MKKIVFSLLLLTSLMLVACGNKDKENTTSDNSVTEAVETTIEKTTQIEENTIDVTRATISDAVLTNETFKISFPITSDMQVLSDTEMLARMGVGKNIAEGQQYTIADCEDSMHGISYDAMISIPDIKSAVSITYNNVNKSGIAGSTVDEYVKNTSDQLEAYSSPVFTVNSVDDVKLGGIDYKVVRVSADNGMAQRLYIRKEANYFIQIAVTFSQDNEKWADEFEASFIETK